MDKLIVKKELFNTLYDLYELSRYSKSVKEEFKVLKNIDLIADSFDLADEFLKYLDLRLEEEGILFTE